MVAVLVEKGWVNLNWKIASLFPNIQKIVPVLTPDQISDLKIRIEQDLAMGDDGFLYQTARANAIVGSVV